MKISEHFLRIAAFEVAQFIDKSKQHVCGMQCLRHSVVDKVLNHAYRSVPK
ncbi:MAG: hypothetical protein OXM61_09320 [Candidatus Poribacteria bacterium]|nr:hypothetical protein [Candidatus Poribacteria bacterium]